MLNSMELEGHSLADLKEPTDNMALLDSCEPISNTTYYYTYDSK